MSNDLVAYSRAGDIFHYRWAARRCLRLIRPGSPLRKIVIEGSSEKEKAGEYVIDVTEYAVAPDGNTHISYYQLKHTTVQGDKPFLLSDLEDTFTGFARRFTQHKNQNTADIADITYTIITNRKIDTTFKQNIAAITNKETVNARFKSTLEKYTELTSDDLASFCSNIQFDDSEGNYNVQKDELRIDLSRLIAGTIDTPQINNLVALTQDKVMPHSNGEILREEVLKCFGIISNMQLFPAPGVWESLDNIIEKEQYSTLITHISNAQHPVIVHAAGGVGKSVFCHQLIKSLPYGSLGIAYDCFGAGSYRNRSETRHRHRDALVQIANELSSEGLCEPLIVPDTTHDEDIMRRFLVLIQSAVEALRKTVSTAQLFILIDAADNAEMAAQEFHQSCFAHELLREKIPVGCQLILLCRTERIYLLQPASNILEFELQPFTESETTENLRKRYPDATDNDGIEFHRLTGANPRVQANALDANYNTVNELLRSLGPSGATVELQIESQLQLAVAKMRDLLSAEFSNAIDSICLGLASLPPHIPIDILAKAAGVQPGEVKSFVSDIGRSLWLSDASVQFRDEPTETWFRKTYLAKAENYQTYINILEPLAAQSTYVAEVLPQLYLQAGQYGKLIDIALSDDYLPEHNPIDARNIRVQRLQFAFKAALKAKQLNDAVKLAMRAGEEMAGNQRQLSLLQNNTDMISLLQSKEKVQEIAFKGLPGSKWDGSENVYSASLLSGIEEYKGEARGYLRSAMNWLHIYFEEKRKSKKNQRNDDDISDNDVLELAYAHLNIFDLKECLRFLLSLQPKQVIFRTVQDLAKRLVDLGRLDELNGLLHLSIREPYYVVAITSQLLTIGIIPEKADIETCLDLLCSSKDRIETQDYTYNDRITPAIISFLEVCLHHRLSPRKILRALRCYIPIRATRMVSDSHFSNDRDKFLKALSIRMILSGRSEIDIDEIIPQEFASKEKKHAANNDIRKFEEVVSGLIPWYLLRANILYGNDINLNDAAKQTSEASHKARNSRYINNDSLPYEVTGICTSILILSATVDQKEAIEFYYKLIHDAKAFWLPQKLELLYAVYRIPQLSDIRPELESNCHKDITDSAKERPDEIADNYISMARAVSIESIEDARAYFDEAVNIVSKFGDELLQRWDAVVSLAEQASSECEISNELAYRFIRCAELVGENVSREKHWNRSEAVQVCARMSSGIGISAFSRWRDRHIGRFEYQLESLIIELVNSGKITSAIGWSLTRFFSQHQLNNVLSICLENETSPQMQQALLDDAVHLLQIEGTNEDYWKELKAIASGYNLTNPQLDFIINSFNSAESMPPETRKESYNTKSDSEEKNWDILFNGISIATHDGFENLMQRFKKLQDEDEFQWNERNLQDEILKRLSNVSALDFIEVILQSPHIDYYDALHIFSNLPTKWTNKISFRRQWPDIVSRLGQHYANNLTQEYTFNNFKEYLHLDQSLTEKLKSGLLSGLEKSNDLTDAESFFGFVKLVAHSLEVKESTELTAYSLSRFEQHIEDDFGDGIWNSRLEVSNDVNKNIAGFIWSALGSPRSVERWNAAHCVRKLAELRCTEVLDALINWMEYDKTDAFGCAQYPFYNLHARQYLLIALARVSLDQPDIVRKYSAIFSEYALSTPHILIQKYASEIAINIQKACPETYKEDRFTQISNVGKSAFEIQEKDYGDRTNSYWHEKGEIDTDIDYNFAYDFDRYWLEPLGRVFAIPGNQIEQLAANVIINEWGISYDGGYNNDPRVGLWNQSYERETWHNNAGYPRTDNLNFYLSYHAMLVVAAKLISKMPVVKTSDCEEDEWKDWLATHILTPQDGRWLVDFRDPIPLKRPQWITEDIDKDEWKNDITQENFINCLQETHSGELWLNVKGGWHEKKKGKTETFSITSALVSKETSESLMRALDTCTDPYNFSLPDYDGNDAEIKKGKFILKGWINESGESLRVDEADPYTNNISYPPYSVGEDIIEKLQLSCSDDGREWCISGTNEISMICEAWSSYVENKKEDAPEQAGIKLKAQLPFLKYLCQTLGCDLIFKVRIGREIDYKYRSEGKWEYAKPRHKIFILSADGRLKTTGSDYKLG